MLALRNGSAPATRGTPVNRLVDRLLDESFFAPVVPHAWTTMPLSMWQDEENVYLEVDAPGLKHNDIDVSVHEGVVTISGERKCQRQIEGFDSRTYGRFEQRIALPSAVDAGKVEARLADGVLSLTFPKSEEAKPRKIAIKTA